MESIQTVRLYEEGEEVVQKRTTFLQEPLLAGHDCADEEAEDESTPLLDKDGRSTLQVPAAEAPEDATWWSRLTFSWMNPIMWLGVTRQLAHTDLLPMPADMAPRACCGRLWRLWLKERQLPLEKASLLRAIYRAYGRAYLKIGVLKLVNDGLAFAGPILLHELVSLLDASPSKGHRPSDETLIWGYSCAAALGLTTAVRAFLGAHYTYQVSRLGLQLRASVTTCVFRKALCVSSATRGVISGGEIQTLMSVDAERVVNLCISAHELWSLPLQLAVALFLLYLQVRFAFLAGLVVVILLIPINRWLATRISAASQQMMKDKDERIRRMGEILAHIRTIKVHAWERFFVRRVGEARQRELHSLAVRKYLDAFCVYFWACTPIFFSLLTFGLYALLGHRLTAATVFTSLALFNVLLAPLNSFPWVINGLVEAGVSLKRLHRFLASPDLDGDWTNGPHAFDAPPPSGGELPIQTGFPGLPSHSQNGEPPANALHVSQEGAIVAKSDLAGSETVTRGSVPGDLAESDSSAVVLSGADFTWEEVHLTPVKSFPGGEPQLRGLSLSITRGSLVVIIGEVGAGKSSLLAAALGEMHCTAGGVAVKGSTALVPQTPWIHSGSLRDNILFGLPFQEDRYEKALRACALDLDVEGMPHGDLTEIGERGLNLSGGQKARLALARAVYRAPDVILLDDPLAAVDAQVAAQVLKHALTGPLVSSSTRILCTHNRQALALADVAVVLHKGSIAYDGAPAGIPSGFLEAATSLKPAIQQPTDFLPALEEASKAGSNGAGASASLGASVSVGGSSGKSRWRSALNGALQVDEREPESDSQQDAAPSQQGTPPPGQEGRAAPSLGHLASKKWLRRWKSESDQRRQRALGVPRAALIYQEVTRGIVNFDRRRSASDQPSDAAYLRLFASDSAGAASPRGNTRQHRGAAAPGTRRRVSSGEGWKGGGVADVAANGLGGPQSQGGLREAWGEFGRVGRSRSEGATSTLMHARAAAMEEAADSDETAHALMGDPGLVAEEAREAGHVRLAVYGQYAGAVGGFMVAMVLLALLLMQASRNASDLWLTVWVDATSPSAAPSRPAHSLKFYLGILALLALANSAFTLARAFFFAYSGLRAARRLHELLLARIVAAPADFFDRTPSGRILNRFSSDLYTVDDSLPFIANILLANSFNLLGILLVLIYTQWTFALLLVPLSLFYGAIQRYYRCTSRELRRLDSSTRSPIYAAFSEALEGAPTIRAFREQARFAAENEARVGVNQRAAFCELGASLWLTIRLQMLAAVIVTFIAVMAVAGRHVGPGGAPAVVTAGMVGLGLSYALPIVSLLNDLLTSFAETEKEMVAVERVQQYLEVEREAEDVSVAPPKPPPEGWPANGCIEFQHVWLRYRPDLPAALQDLTFTLAGGEQVGVAGRTGAGKSSILAALFRLYEISAGRVLVDGVDISQVAPRELRMHLAVIPQTPFLFEGSVRLNVDPDQALGDDVLWDMLRKCHMADAVALLGGLDARVAEAGSSLSLGERQLLCLARALLRRSKVLCLDECTANVDPATAAVLQAVIEAECRGGGITVLTIAHRISTIMGLPRVLLVDAGRLVEDGDPKQLVKDSRSKFSVLASAADLK